MKKYNLQNLDCPNCALKIEKRLREKGINDARVDFISLSLTTSETDIEKINKIIREVEEDVKAIPTETEKVTQVDKSLVISSLNHSLPLLLTILYGIISNVITLPSMIDYILVLLLLVLGGLKTFRKAVLNIKSGSFFDENFLVSLATIVAVILGEKFEGLLLISLFNIGLFLEEVAIEKSKEKIQKQAYEIIGKARVKTNEGERIVDVYDINIGDIVVVKPGERIPIDGEIIKGSSFIDRSSITGESIPESVSVGEKVIAGSINLDGILEIKATSKFNETSIYKILNEVNSVNGKSKTERFITKLSKVYTPAVLLIALIISTVPPVILNTYEFKEWIVKGLVIVIISCPCAIVISVPLTYFKALGILSSKNILVKNTSSLDQLSQAKVVFFDKTGTITKTKLQIKEIFTYNNTTEEDILKLSALVGQYSSHAISKSILHHINYNIPEAQVDNLKEIPGYGIIANINGQEIILGNDRLLHKKTIPHPKCITDTTAVHISRNGEYIGYITFEDTEREEAKDVIEELKHHGIKETILLTGDNRENAIKIANKLNINKVFFQKTPEEKAKIIEEYKTNTDDTILYIGDGINDSIAMIKADVSVSFNTPLNSLITTSSDIVVNSNNLNKIVEAIIISRNTKKVVVQNLIIALSIKTIIGVLGILGIAPIWLAVMADTGTTLLTISNTMIRDFSKHHHN